ncbi:MAG: endonuclease/exonuclease/phosphatase family protein [Acholeplasmatales bacterium]|nr:endonuclease/exonuclease/phosphatase family protein [Acholeplasmatales bacterium]
MLKKIIKIVLFVLAILVLTLGGFLIYSGITTLHVDDVEKLKVDGKSSKVINKGDNVKLMTWNVGYCALGDNESFFMDGGDGVVAKDKKRVESNLSNIIEKININNPDVIFLQEVDIKCKRSCKIDEKEEFEEALDLNKYNTTFAYNYKAGYIPYPFPTALGHVEAGIQTFSKYEIKSSDRIKLYNPFNWPISMFNLKRCLAVNRIAVGDKELVIVNQHLEAYDDGDGKEEQTKELKSLIDKEYELGNYVIVGGDFNQSFTNIDTSMYPFVEGNWKPGVIDSNKFENFNLLMDNSYPTCRSLSTPYVDKDKKTFPYYMIDGFMVSKNITVESINTLNYGFENSDHNPVLLNIVIN